MSETIYEQNGCNLITDSSSNENNQIIYNENNIHKPINSCQNLSPKETRIDIRTPNESNTILKKEKKFKINYSSIRQKILGNHSISNFERAQMVNLMFEILSKFNSNLNTLFYSVHLMDKYFLMEMKSQNADSLHLIGVVCLQIASKLEDIQCLNTPFTSAKICHHAFDELKIREKERYICKTLNYDLKVDTIIDFIKYFTKILEDFFTKKYRINFAAYFKEFRKIAINISKTTLYKSRLMQFDFSLIAVCCLLIARLDINVFLLFPPLEKEAFNLKIANKLTKLIKGLYDNVNLVVQNVIIMINENSEALEINKNALVNYKLYKFKSL